MLSDLPPTFVYFSTAANGDFIVGLRQWRCVSLQEFDDIRLNSLQFANLLFQMKALERQFMEEDVKLSSVNLDGFMSTISRPPSDTARSCRDYGQSRGKCRLANYHR